MKVQNKRFFIFWFPRPDCTPLSVYLA